MRLQQQELDKLIGKEIYKVIEDFDLINNVSILRFMFTDHSFINIEIKSER
jgi:hypothetical protein